MRRRYVVAGLVTVAGLGSYEMISSEIERGAQFKRGVGEAVVKDRFTEMRHSTDSPDSGGNVTIGELVLGRCTFHDVTAHVKRDGDTVTDVSDYSFAVGQVGQGKFQSDSITLTFNNAGEARDALPDLNCDSR